MADTSLQELLSFNDYSQSLFDYLYKRNRLPFTKMTSMLPPGTLGTYTPHENTVRVHPASGLGTLVHEMTHAADNALEQQYYDRPTSWNKPDTQTYFTDAYDKLKGRTSNTYYNDRRGELANKLNSEWYKKNQDYRSTGNELSGWAGKRTVRGEQEPRYEAPDHLDSTLATEMSILLDLARRKDIPFPKQPPWWERMFK